MIKIGNNLSEWSSYSCQPKTKKELEEIIKERMIEQGEYCDLNDIDTSLITDMSWLFEESNFNGDISEWNVSNVLDMSLMFIGSLFNQDISNWNIHEHCNTFYMFNNCKIDDKFIPTKQMHSKQFSSARLEFK